MWVYLSDAFLSIVAHRDKPETLLVRARFEGDLERVFPDHAGQVQRTPRADYLFRVEVPRDEVALMLALSAVAIDAPNFKASVAEPWRAKVCSDVWSVMWKAQHDRDSVQSIGRIRDKLDDEYRSGLDGVEGWPA
ncbi:MAG: hypothetical protein AB7P94_16775 [Steroidobacteraceae bacterium]